MDLVIVILLVAVLVVISVLTGFIVKRSHQTSESTAMQSAQSNTAQPENGVHEKLDSIENKIDRIDKLTSASGIYNIGLTAMVAGLTFFIATFTLAGQGVDFDFAQFARSVEGVIFIVGVVLSIVGIIKIFKARSTHKKNV